MTKVLYETYTEHSFIFSCRNEGLPSKYKLITTNKWMNQATKEVIKLLLYFCLANNKSSKNI